MIIQLMNIYGDKQIKNWDPDNPGDLEKIKGFFKKKLKEGFRAFAFKEGEDVGKYVQDFDPDSEKILLSADRVKLVVPPVRG